MLYFQSDKDDGGFFPPDDIAEAMSLIEQGIADDECDDYDQGRYEVLTAIMSVPTVLLADLFKETLHDILEHLMNGSEEEETKEKEETVNQCNIATTPANDSNLLADDDISDEEMLAELAPKTVEPTHEPSD